MDTLLWLSLVDYSNKYKLSISTLRRRIKLDTIKFKLDTGKYYILDEEPKEVSVQTPILSKKQGAPIEADLPNPLMGEVKQAFTRILQEKDEQIKLLHAEISDLRTLIRVLEGELLRYQNNQELTLEFE